MFESVSGVYVFRLSVGDAVGDAAAIHASEEDDPCGLEKPITSHKGQPNRWVTNEGVRRPLLLATATQSLYIR
jgi:hypothetical protein